jgi:GT2 family glycosyltransferase
MGFKKKSIPILGVPIVNGVHWLERLLNSIDYPVDEVLIINNNGRGEITEQLNQLCEIHYDYIKKIKVLHMPSNLGVASSWNLIIKSYINLPYWVISNHDVGLIPGCLDELMELAKDEEVGFVGDGPLFLIKDTTIQKCGLFDENFYPAYLEDLDYYMRMRNENVKRSSLKSLFYHGETIYYSETGSQTWRTDLSLKNKIDFSRESNEYYMREKWGNDWVGPGWSYYNPFKNPFNNQNLYNSYTTFDLKFLRRKHLGF